MRLKELARLERLIGAHVGYCVVIESTGIRLVGTDVKFSLSVTCQMLQIYEQIWPQLALYFKELLEGKIPGGGEADETYYNNKKALDRDFSNLIPYINIESDADIEEWHSCESSEINES